MRAVIYLVSGAVSAFLLYPPQVLPALLALFTPEPVGLSLQHTPLTDSDADNAAVRTALLRGTNKVSTETLLQAGLAPDALEMGADLDGDGDPDDIHLRLEVAMLSADPDAPWAFVPKAFGMSQWQLPQTAPGMTPAASPDLRFEQGDTVLITFENSLHLPLSLQFDGVDAVAQQAAVPGASLAAGTSISVLPGQALAYRLSPLSPGEARYQAQDPAAAARGLQGRILVEENQPDNALQTVDTAWLLATPAVTGALIDTSVSASMDADAVLQYSGFGLALGLALAGMGGLLPLRRRRAVQEHAP
jgi:hypothetical protein